MLQFITNASTTEQTVEQAQKVLEGGCRWVQLRMKDAPQHLLRQTLLDIIPLTKKYGATLIVDDHVELAAYSGVAGVHLGANDMSPTDARRILGPDKIIGMTVNSYDAAQQAGCEPVDYYGVGPWRFTTTKKALAPVLGAEGVKKIVRHLKSIHPERHIVVIGGITTDDIVDVLATGADGVAVSGAITGIDAISITRKFINSL